MVCAAGGEELSAVIERVWFVGVHDLAEEREF